MSSSVPIALNLQTPECGLQIPIWRGTAPLSFRAFSSLQLL